LTNRFSSTINRWLVKSFWSPALLGILCSCSFAAEPELSDVFVAGENGFPAIRIPSVVVTKDGTVLAFAEARNAPHPDQAANKIVLKRSTDDGRTWGAMQIIAADGGNSLNNPTTLVEQDNGRVWLMYQRIPAHLKETSRQIATGYEGTNIYRNFLIGSDDNGVTWSHPRDVTRSTKRPTGATTIASGPGIGIQLTRGPHKGRIIFPFNEGPFWQWNNFTVFSDDRGATWRYGENVPGVIILDAKGQPRSQVNEVQMVELADGSVRLNSRQFAGAKVRKTAVSHDGGVTWSPIADVPELRDPSCMGSIFRFALPGDGVKSRILYSGPDSSKRENGTIHISYDEGKTWPVKKVLFPGSFGYSVLTKLSDGTIGCFFEADGADRMVFARFPLSWLEGIGTTAKSEPK
jgi:sialidase-1